MVSARIRSWSLTSMPASSIAFAIRLICPTQDSIPCPSSIFTVKNFLRKDKLVAKPCARCTVCKFPQISHGSFESMCASCPISTLKIISALASAIFCLSRPFSFVVSSTKISDSDFPSPSTSTSTISVQSLRRVSSASIITRHSAKFPTDNLGKRTPNNSSDILLYRRSRCGKQRMWRARTNNWTVSWTSKANNQTVSWSSK